MKPIFQILFSEDNVLVGLYRHYNLQVLITGTLDKEGFKICRFSDVYINIDKSTFKKINLKDYLKQIEEKTNIEIIKYEIKTDHINVVEFEVKKMNIDQIIQEEIKKRI